MFDNLSDRLTHIFSRLKRTATLSPDDIQEALREIRIALLEADVALPVVKQFIADIKAKASGQEVFKSLTPEQTIIKMVHEHLVTLLGSEAATLQFQQKAPFCYMVVGLQGSGKTTTTAKLGHFLTQQSKKVLLVSLDVYRPAAQHQLETLAIQNQLAVLPIVPDEKPLAIAQRALATARQQSCEVILFDTAGRLHIDSALMEELEALQKLVQPLETLLVADSMTGQDAVNVARAFHERLSLTGIILTRVDGDARGGACLSMKAVTGCPIKFLATGEKIKQLEPFQPERMASRILGMGDVLSLIEKVTETVSKEEAEALAQKMQKGHFDLDDMARQLAQMNKMGGLSGLMGLIPGLGQLKQQMQNMPIDPKQIDRQIAIIRSMTLKERRDHRLINGSRRKRIAQGSGATVMEVNRLLKQYHHMQQMMQRMRRMDPKALKRQGLRGLLGI